MTGYDEAVEWLAENQSGFTLVKSEQSPFSASSGRTTGRGEYHVTLNRKIDIKTDNLIFEEDIVLEGIGHSILDAVQAAVGTLRS